MSKTINGLIIGISVFLVIVLIIVSILMILLKGKHTITTIGTEINLMI